jgi:multicomponent Na+:H+ antiporter subunit A
MSASAPGTTFIVLMLPFLAALVAPWLTRRLGHNAAWLLALAPAAIFIHFLGFSAEVADGGIVTGGFQWVPSYNVSFSWLIDGLSLTFALLISGIGALIILYSGGYLKGHEQLGRFFSFMLLFMGAMLGLVISDSFLMLFIFWELTSITSFLLIGFDHTREASRRAAIQALVVTGGGGLALLAGLLVIWNITGVSQVSLLLILWRRSARKPVLPAGAVPGAGRRLFQIGAVPAAFLAAQRHGSADAGLGLSALGHHGQGRRLPADAAQSGARRHRLVGDHPAGVRRRHADRRHAARHPPDRPEADAGLHHGFLARPSGHADRLRLRTRDRRAVLYLVAHSLFKGALFMVAGLIDHEAGTRDVTRLGGLRKAMPVTFIAALAGAISMAACRRSSASSPRRKSTTRSGPPIPGRCSSRRRHCRQRPDVRHRLSPSPSSRSSAPRSRPRNTPMRARCCSGSDR